MCRRLLNTIVNLNLQVAKLSGDNPRIIWLVKNKRHKCDHKYTNKIKSPLKNAIIYEQLDLFIDRRLDRKKREKDYIGQHWCIGLNSHVHIYFPMNLIQLKKMKGTYYIVLFEFIVIIYRKPRRISSNLRYYCSSAAKLHLKLQWDNENCISILHCRKQRNWWLACDYFFITKNTQKDRLSPALSWIRLVNLLSV